MKIRLNSLILQTRREPVEIKFNSINYFYGPISAGKSTIGRLIQFCFGKNMNNTVALQAEFLSARLKLQIGEYNVEISRNKDAQELVVKWEKLGHDANSVIAPRRSVKDSPILVPDTTVQNISDLMYYLADITPPKVLKNKRDENAKLIRLSFRDLLWYCYLPQEEMDSSFFNLLPTDDQNKRPKSRDVMRSILGFYREEISDIEKKLVDAKQQKLTTEKAVEQIRNIMKEYKIPETKVLEDNKKSLEKKLMEIHSQINDIKKRTLYKGDNPIDDLKEKRSFLDSSINQLRRAIDDIDSQITKQVKLRHEYLTYTIKNNRTQIASQLLDKVEFDRCPKCHETLSAQNIPSSTCPLCKQPESVEKSDLIGINTELLDRAKELEVSIKNFEEEKYVLNSRLLNVIDEKREMEMKINEHEKNNDSQFLTAATGLLNEQGEIKGKIIALEKNVMFSKKADELEQESIKLEIQIRRLQDEFLEAKKKAEKDQENLDLLKQYFFDNLKRAKFPKIDENYEVEINTNDFIPIVKLKKGGEISIVEFSSLGSGGKMTLFKTCYALALHRLSAHSGGWLPTLLIIDSPMKNIEIEEDREIFENLHKLIYELAASELKEVQFILIGSSFIEPDKSLGLNVYSRKMTREINSPHPPLIPYYEGQ